MSRRHRTQTSVCLLLVALLVSCGGDSANSSRPLVVFAAASLRDVVTEVAVEFEHRQSISVELNFAGSNTLAQQIRAVPRADVFLSADLHWVDFLADEGLTRDEAPSAFLANQLVVIAHQRATCRLSSLADLATAEYRFLAMADPEGVPAGRYARLHLERETAPEGGNLWAALTSRLAPTLDVRAALALVESDPEILGVVYRTDALSSAKVRVLFEVPAVAGIEIRYWSALLKGGRRPHLGREFVEFLSGSEAGEIMQRHGFVLALRLPMGT